ncbi:hypothetical protein BDV3_004538 [Batrachochytrium dendrobatidis]|nr:hypothetical protein BDEG_23010 [Batrachochytrium dendrobatidis JEL423]
MNIIVCRQQSCLWNGVAVKNSLVKRLLSTSNAISKGINIATAYPFKPAALDHYQPRPYARLDRISSVQRFQVRGIETDVAGWSSMHLPQVNMVISETGEDGVALYWGRPGYEPRSPANIKPDDGGRFHYAWLRDNCQCPSCILESNGQKLHSSASVSSTVKPVSISVVNTNLVIEWPADSLCQSNGVPVKSEPHKSEFSIEWLQSNNYNQQPRSPSTIRSIRWDGAYLKACTHRVSYDEFFNHYSGLRSVIQQLHDFGICFLTDVPTDDKRVEHLAKRMGCIQETFYGTSWDVRNEPDASNIAYTSLYLGLHMDLMYYESPPGLQLLHCLQNNATGGESTFVDSHIAVELLKREYPDHYKTLTKVPIMFKYQKDLHHMQYRHPTILENDQDLGLQVYYAPQFQGPLDATPDLVLPFYEAFSVFESILNRKELLYTTLLRPGDCAIFSNRRILHGRQSFDPQSGVRHLKGTYISWDDFKDLVRIHLI